MSRSNRLFEITRILQDGARHRACDIARVLRVTPRTIYRDMDTLHASGVPVSGTRGLGYRMAQLTTLPPISLDDAEIEALHLGLAIAGEAADTELKSAALSLAAKVDAALPFQAVTKSEDWKFATYPFAENARGIAQLPTLRAAIKGRQKLRLTYNEPDGTVTSRIVRPLKVAHFSRIWTLTAWCESNQVIAEFRVDLIHASEALPQLFQDEPGKTLEKPSN